MQILFSNSQARRSEQLCMSKMIILSAAYLFIRDGRLRVTKHLETRPIQAGNFWHLAFWWKYSKLTIKFSFITCWSPIWLKNTIDLTSLDWVEIYDELEPYCTFTCNYAVNCILQKLDVSVPSIWLKNLSTFTQGASHTCRSLVTPQKPHSSVSLPPSPRDTFSPTKNGHPPRMISP